MTAGARTTAEATRSHNSRRERRTGGTETAAEAAFSTGVWAGTTVTPTSDLHDFLSFDASTPSISAIWASVAFCTSPA